MSQKTEKIFSELQKAMKDQTLENEEQVNAFINQFMKEYNDSLDNHQSLDSYDYLQMAEEADTEEEAIKYARKALKLNPYCLDAELIIAHAKSETIDDFKKNLEKLIQKGEKQLAERNISMEEDAGHFYGILETRPYMRIRKAYLEVLLEMGRFGRAVNEAEGLLQLCESDNLGVRYTLMALYSYFEEEGKALELYRKYKEDTAFMLLPLIALYYKMDDSRKMRTYISKLKNKNPDVQEALEIIMSGDEEELAKFESMRMYRPFSVEEVILATSEASYLYLPMNHFLLRIYTEMAK